MTLTRPFRPDAWQVLGLVILACLLMIVLPRKIIKNYQSTQSCIIVATTSWFLFVLINSYYGGALTMFFVSEITLPFETIKDALKVFPEWKILYQSGNDALFDLPASQV